MNMGVSVIDKTKSIIFWVIQWIYPKIFKEEPSEMVLQFIKNLGYVTVGFTAAKFFSFFFQVYVGRTLGTVEYGKFVLVYSVAMFLYLPMLLGIDTALTKYLAEQKNEEEKSKIISTGFTLILISVIISSIIFFTLSPWIALISSVSQKYVYGAVLIAIFYSSLVFSQKIEQGLYKMKVVSAIELAWCITSVIVILSVLFFMKDARAPVIALIIGYAVASFLVLPDLRRYLVLKFDRRWAKTLTTFGSYAILAGAASVILHNIDRIFINKYLSVADVGLYHAYSFSTIYVAGFFMTMFVTVFFPEASRSDKVVIWDKIKKLIIFVPLLAPVFLVVSWIILKLYGAEYEFILPLISLFVLTTLITTIYSTIDWYVVSFGINGVKVASFSIIFASIANLILNYELIPLFGLYGAIGSTIGSYVLALPIILLWVRGKINDEVQVT